MDELRRRFGDIPDAAIEQRVMLWPLVNWILPIRLTPVGGGEDMLAAKGQPLPAVPRAGENLVVLRQLGIVDRVQWIEDGKIMVVLRTMEFAQDAIEELTAEGWTVFPRTDPDSWIAQAMNDE